MFIYYLGTRTGRKKGGELCRCGVEWSLFLICSYNETMPVNYNRSRDRRQSFRPSTTVGGEFGLNDIKNLD